MLTINRTHTNERSPESSEIFKSVKDTETKLRTADLIKSSD